MAMPDQDRARYDAVSDEVFALYGEERYDEALSRIRAAAPGLARWRADLAHAEACLLAVSGRPGEALAELRVALDDGAWWHQRILLDEDDLHALQSLNGFADLVERSHARALEAADAAAPPLVHRPDGRARGLVVALHGAGEDAGTAARQWAGAVEAGLTLVAVESSQRDTPTYRSWPDPVIGQRDITRALDTLEDDDRRLPLVAAGFSAGGRQALRWTLEGGAHGVPAGFVVVAPAVFPEQVHRQHLAAAAARGVTGIVLLGENDDDVGEGALATYECLRQGGLACRLDLVPGLGHAYPTDLAARVVRFLDEILGGAR